jgi:hypothetical protein
VSGNGIREFRDNSNTVLGIRSLIERCVNGRGGARKSRSIVGSECTGNRRCLAHWSKDKANKEEGGGLGMNVGIHLRNGVL